MNPGRMKLWEKRRQVLFELNRGDITPDEAARLRQALRKVNLEIFGKEGEEEHGTDVRNS